MWLPKKSPGAKAGDKEKQLRGESPAVAVYTKGTQAHQMSLQAEPPSFKLYLRGGKEVIRLAHNQKIDGANPSSATNVHRVNT